MRFDGRLATRPPAEKPSEKDGKQTKRILPFWFEGLLSGNHDFLSAFLPGDGVSKLYNISPGLKGTNVNMASITDS